MEPGVYALKTTGERVYLYGAVQVPDGIRAQVHRAKMGEQGIVHEVEVFDFEELESLEDNFKREINEMLLKAKLQQDALKKARQADEAAEGESVAVKLQVN